MRISTIQAFNNGVSGIQRNYANVTRTQEQISTGNRMLTPADDPVAAVRLLQLEQQQNVLTQYKENLTAAKNSLTQEETTVTSVVNVLQRIRELAVQAGGGALSGEDRKSIAKELGEREGELLNLMNSRNARGEYLFSGFLGKTEPFLRNPDGTYSYQGDEGQRSLQVAGSSNVALIENLEGEVIDDLPVEISHYGPPRAEFLSSDPELRADEVLVSHLLKSNCPVTGQPDWASVQIRYAGPRIARDGLLRYLVSYRNHSDFHEQCVERIFMDLWTRCKPIKLEVYARYTRRGGLDINPWRTSHPMQLPPNTRTARQ